MRPSHFRTFRTFRTNARTFADMFRTTAFLAVFVALIASAQADLPVAKCADYKKDNGTLFEFNIFTER